MPEFYDKNLPGSVSPDIQIPVEAGETKEDIWFRSELMRATEKIIEDDLVERHLDTDNFPLWSIASKSLKLTFLEPDDILSLENLFEAEVCKFLRSIPPCRHNSDLYLKLGQARIIFLANARRALGTKDRDKMNERIALLSQIKQIITSSTEQSSPGFFKKLFGVR